MTFAASIWEWNTSQFVFHVLVFHFSALVFTTVQMSFLQFFDVFLPFHAVKTISFDNMACIALLMGSNIFWSQFQFLCAAVAD